MKPSSALRQCIYALVTRPALSPSYVLSQQSCLALRNIHSTPRTPAVASQVLPPSHRHSKIGSSRSYDKTSHVPPLSGLPLSTLIRSILVQYASSKSMLLRPSLAILSFLADAKSPLLAPDRNPVLRFLLKKQLYNLFCAGENSVEVAETTRGLKSWGVQGILLGWAREVEFRGNATNSDAAKADAIQEALSKQDGGRAIKEWSDGVMKTIACVGEGDHVAVKYVTLLYIRTKHLCRGVANVAISQILWCRTSCPLGIYELNITTSCLPRIDS